MNKRRIEITINGEAYPCYETGGAMLRFKDLTGKEVTEIEANSVSDLIKFLWCCTVSACAREKKQFPLGLMEFADCIDQSHLLEWQKAVNKAQEEEATAGVEQKKSLSE